MPAMPHVSNIRQTFRVSQSSHPEEYAFLLALHYEGESWATTMLRIVQMAMKAELGDPQMARIERKVDQLITLVKEQPRTVVVQSQEEPTKEVVDTGLFGAGIGGW